MIFNMVCYRERMTFDFAYEADDLVSLLCVCAVMYLFLKELKFVPCILHDHRCHSYIDPLMQRYLLQTCSARFYSEHCRSYQEMEETPACPMELLV